MPPPRDPDPLEATLAAPTPPADPEATPVPAPAAPESTATEHTLPQPLRVVDPIIAGRTPSPMDIGDTLPPPGDATAAGARILEAFPPTVPDEPIEPTLPAPMSLTQPTDLTLPAPSVPGAPGRAPGGEVSATEVDATRLAPSPAGTNASPDPTRPAGVTGGVTTPGRSGAAGGASSGPAVGRFALRALHAKGGLGEVFTATDTELNREVALKRIQARYADDPHSRRRFLAEAEITARLDHPGVVPVFGLVADRGGRPCYAMRFIRGESLREEIERFYRKPDDSGPKTAGEGQKPAEAAPGSTAIHHGAHTDDARRLAFRALLQRFVAVCQAIAYAHTRNVIHRDIKPANVMVGSFGETLVVDWGLAKALDSGTDAADLLAVARTGRGSVDVEVTDELTAMGMAVGTPAYMSPEQAAGRIDIVGPAADIYSLGATLYCILTGKAPFTGGDPADTLRRVQHGEFPPPHALNSNVPQPLEAVCLKAMAARPEDRYPTARDLAADCERWLCDEPVSCFRDPFPARLARWARRHPARVAVAVSLLIAGVVAFAVGFGLVNREQKKTADALALVTTQKEKTEEQRKAAEAERDAKEKARAEEERQKRRAEAAGELARERLRIAQDTFDTLVTGIQTKLKGRAGTQAFRQDLLEAAAKGLDRLLATLDKGGAEGQEAERREAARLKFWAYLRMGELYQSQGKTDDAHKLFEKARDAAAAWLKLDPTNRDAQAAPELVRARLAGVQALMGDSRGARQTAEAARDRWAELAARPDAKPAWKPELAAVRDLLAGILLDQGEVSLAAQESGLSLAERRALPAAVRDREVARSLDRQAEIAFRTGDIKAVDAAVNESLKLREAVAAASLPDATEVQQEHAAAHVLRGRARFARGEFTQAREDFRKADDILAKALAADEESAGAKADRLTTLDWLALAELRLGRTPEGLRDAAVALKLALELADADPGSDSARRAVAAGLRQYGVVLLEAGRAAEALTHFGAARELFQALSDRDPANARARGELAEAVEWVGLARLAVASGSPGEAKAAIGDLAAGVEMRRAALKQNEASAVARRRLAEALGQLADARLRAGETDAGEQNAYESVQQFVALASTNPVAKLEAARAYARWAEAAAALDRPAPAIILLDKSVDRLNRVLLGDPANARAKEEMAGVLEQVADALGRLGEVRSRVRKEAEAAALRIELQKQNPESLTARRDVVRAYRRVGDAYRAERAYPQARAHYAAAREAVKAFGFAADDPLIAGELRQLATAELFCSALEVGTQNPKALKDYPPEMRTAVLKELIRSFVERRKAADADRATRVLAETAGNKADELYFVAWAYNRCAELSPPGRGRVSFEHDATTYLRKAVEAGYRDRPELNADIWKPYRDRPELRGVFDTPAPRKE